MPLNDRILTIDIISLRCFLPSPSIGLESLHRSFSTCGSRLSRVMSDEFVRTLSYLYLQYKSSLHATFSAHSLIWASYMWTSFDWRRVPVCFHFRAVCFLLALWDLSRQCGNRRKGPQRSNIPQLIYLLLNGLRLNDRVSSFISLLIFFLLCIIADTVKMSIFIAFILLEVPSLKTLRGMLRPNLKKENSLIFFFLP